jgi:trans-2,3-dihydro-3-hydroxyanthranilate isomerase
MSDYKYCVVDVFTKERFKGNPLSVVFTEGDLDLSVYENISREFGYSETSFIYYSKTNKALKVRSFTPTGFEVNGAGHNLLGAVCAALLTGMEIFHEQDGKQFVIMKDEVIRLSINLTGDNFPFAGMLQKSATSEAVVDPGIIAAALTLNPDEVRSGNLVPTVVKTEVGHLMVPIKNLETLNSSVPIKSLLVEIADEYKFEGVYCFAVLNQDPEYIAESRFFNPGFGIDEDPATGSAAGPLAGFLFQNKYARLDTIYRILQGVKLNHPSVITFEVKTEGIWISGSSILVMEGTIHD